MEDDLHEAKSALIRALRKADGHDEDARPQSWVRKLETIIGKLENLQHMPT